MRCARCVMDTTDPGIEFSPDGTCNHCAEWLEKQPRDEETDGALLIATFQEIKESRKNHSADCLIPVSGGIDSSYVAMTAHRHSLRGALYHLDDGWDTEEAEHNVQAIARSTGYPLIVEEAPRDEYTDLLAAYLKAGVIGVEVVTDQAIRASVYRAARDRGIPYILNGRNTATEAIMPKAWGYRHQDLRNMKAIHRRFGEAPLQNYPMMGTLGIMWSHLQGVEYISPLNMLRYSRSEASEALSSEWGLRSYGRKHHENKFTKWFESWYMPRKWGYDKRKPHYSCLIMNGEMERHRATTALEEPPDSDIGTEIEEVCSGLGLHRHEIEDLARTPPKPHDAYPTDRALYTAVTKALNARRWLWERAPWR